jgi:hypothetical protein
MSVTESNIKLEPCDVFFGLRQKDTLTFVADSSGSLDATYIDFETVTFAGVTTQYRAWFDVDDGSTPPAAGGRTLVEVDIATDDSAATVAAAWQSAVDTAVAGASFTVSGAVVTVENNAMASVTAPVDGASPTGVTVANVFTGEKQDLGGTDGAVEFSPSFDFVDVVADQIGTTMLDKIQSGNNLEVSMSLLEVTSDRWSQIVGNIAGDEMTPSGGTKLVGAGESKRFVNMKQYARELLLKPSGSTDDLRNVTIWKAFPNMDSVNFSGNDLQVMEVTFSAFRDSTKESEINVFAFGDSHQKVLA